MIHVIKNATKKRIDKINGNKTTDSKGDIMKNFRLFTGLSQSKFAEHFGIPIRTVQEWEQGRRKPPEYLLELLKRIWKLESH